MQGDCKSLETPLQRRRGITGSWVFAGRLLSPKPAGVAAGAAGNFRFGAPPACRNFCLHQADSVAASRVMPSFPRPPRFAEGIFYRWRIRKGRAKRQIYPRATVSRFSSRTSNTRAACCTRSGSFLPAEIAVPSACAIARFRRKISHALAAQRTLCARADATFPSNIGAKESRREESRIFPKHRNAAEVHAELSETVRSDTDCPRLSLRACFNRREFLNPQTPRRPLTPPPLSAPNRSSKNIAEPARLRSLRAFPLRSLFEAYCRTA